MNYDIFNGDADGICALHQLRLAVPCESTLITGVKRDIALVERVPAQGDDTVVVLDISFDKNRDAVERFLKQGTKVDYYDHHYAGEIPKNKNLNCYINTAAETCTSLIVNEILGGQYVNWAITAAFGDNLHAQAVALAKKEGLTALQTNQLEELGTLINYNGYGSVVDDLFFPPEQLYKIIQTYIDPFEFINHETAFQVLRKGFATDLAKAVKIKPQLKTEKHGVFKLPNEPWARRISGVYGNMLTQKYPQRAHAVLSEIDNKNYVVSVRASLNNRTGADELCRQFVSGGGRKAAAGINKLPFTAYDEFVVKFKKQFL